MERHINHKMKTTSIGLIPEDWDAKALSQIGVFSKGKGVTRANSQSGDIPCVRYGEIYTSHNNYIRAFYSHISQEIAATATRLKDGDILFAGSGETKEEIGKAVAFLGVEEAYAGGDIIILSPNEGASSKYLGYVLNAAAAVSQKASMGQGDAVVHIHAKELGDVVIPFPKLEEQEKIADALSGVDDMIEVLDEAIAKKRQIKEGLMQQLLTGKTRLPGFSGDWKTICLGGLGDFSQGNGFPVQYQGQKSGDYPFYKVSDFNNLGNELFMRKANNYVNKDIASILSCKIIPQGSIFMAKIGAAIFLERKRLTTAPCCIDNNTMAFIPDKKLFDSLFALYLFQRIHVGDYAEATALPAINLSNLKQHEVLIPATLKEQVSIAHALQSAESDVLSIESLRGKYQFIKQGMMQDLLTGKTRLI